MDAGRNKETFQLNIFGSCLSRDVIEIQEEKKIVLQTYIARESIISALSAPVILEQDRLNLDSAFQRKMIIHDFHKDAFEIFTTKQSDYLLIDFIDERFPLAKVGHSYVTYSNELMVSGYLGVPKLIEWHKAVRFASRRDKACPDKWKIGKINIDKYVTNFCDKLLKIYRPDQIIVHEVYLSDTYISEEGVLCTFPKNHLKNNKLMNEKYEYLYHKFKEYIPNAHVINLSGDYVADEKHKWGLSPMHFQKEYYEKVLSEIYEIMERKNPKC